MKQDTKDCIECEQFKFDYNLITEMCKSGEKIPLLTLDKAESLLYALKPTVIISASHLSTTSMLALLVFAISSS